MNETTFENCRVGDKVYYMDMEAIVYRVEQESGYPILIKLREGVTISFTIDGRGFVHGPQVLFWAPVKVEAPPRPKRMVRNTADGGVNFYPHGIVIYTFNTGQEADRSATSDRLGKAHHIIHEYEVEE